jgi:hypothetical protein
MLPLMSWYWLYGSDAEVLVQQPNGSGLDDIPSGFDTGLNESIGEFIGVATLRSPDLSDLVRTTVMRHTVTVM